MAGPARKFKAAVVSSGGRINVPIPFDPNQAWGRKQRHHVRGTINGTAIRGPLGNEGGRYFISLGAAWRRDAKIDAGAVVSVVLAPEGPQREDLAPDVAAALAAEPQALAFFESLATFYRTGYLRWIDGASRRPEVRAARIAEMVALLKAGQKRR